jgi:5-methylcytosine-specific restriction endonuclease McrA
VRADFASNLKRCSRCRTEKAATEFYRNRAQPDGLDNQCKDCGKAARAASKKKCPESVRAYCARWRARHPEYNRQRQRDWIARRREHVNAYNRGRRQVRLGAPGCGVTKEQWFALLELADDRCVYCGAPATAMDHFLPIAGGGAHDVSNIVPACKSCNSSKKDDDPFDWMDAGDIDGDDVVAFICEARLAASLKGGADAEARPARGGEDRRRRRQEEEEAAARGRGRRRAASAAAPAGRAAAAPGRGRRAAAPADAAGRPRPAEVEDRHVPR